MSFIRLTLAFGLGAAIGLTIGGLGMFWLMDAAPVREPPTGAARISGSPGARRGEESSGGRAGLSRAGRVRTRSADASGLVDPDIADATVPYIPGYDSEPPDIRPAKPQKAPAAGSTHGLFDEKGQVREKDARKHSTANLLALLHRASAGTYPGQPTPAGVVQEPYRRGVGVDEELTLALLGSWWNGAQSAAGQAIVRDPEPGPWARLLEESLTGGGPRSRATAAHEGRRGDRLRL